MDANFNSLPPLKRFRLLQQEFEKQQQELPLPKPEPEHKPDLKPLQTSSSNLPAKKRKQCRYPFIDLNENKENIPPMNPPTPYCLPAKKRIWAFKPEFGSTKNTPSPTFDLNLEYNPSLESHQDSTRLEIESKDVKIEEGHDVDVDVDVYIDVNVDDDVDDGVNDDDGILCAVCESTDGDESDPIVFCDGCDLMVHSTCYGNPLINGIPEGEWFCNQCLNSQSSSSLGKSKERCFLCPGFGGAMKRTKDGPWAHIVCSVLVPEVFFEDPEGRDGIDCSKILKRRWREKCYVCKERSGCVIECSEAKCDLAFHVTCGLKQDLSIELKQGRKNNGGIVAGFCKKHTELWKKQQQTGKFKIVARDEES